VVVAALVLLGGGATLVGQHLRPIRLPSGEWDWMRTGGFTTSDGGARIRSWVQGVDWFARVDIDVDGDGEVDLVAEDWQGPAPERCYRRASSGWVLVAPSECQRAAPDGL
jgi:hypothetical protein